MIKEALEYITGLARDGDHAEVLDIPDPRVQRMLVKGSLVTVDKPAAPRAHIAHSVGGLIRLANRFNADAETCVVWYNAERVTLVVDDSGHRVNTVVSRLEHSAIYETLGALDRGKTWLAQRDFVRLLRIDLSEALPEIALLNIVRKVKFENGVITTAKLTRASESMGREIVSSVAAEGPIPEEVELQVPVYKLGTTYTGQCSVEVDLDRGMFRLLPYPDELYSLQQLALTTLHEELRDGLDEGVLFYCGHP